MMGNQVRKYLETKESTTMNWRANFFREKNFTNRRRNELFINMENFMHVDRQKHSLSNFIIQLSLNLLLLHCQLY